MTVRLSDALIEIAEKAKANGFPTPVIVTDVMTAAHLRKLLEDDLHGRLPKTEGCIVMFDGVKITHPGWPMPKGWPKWPNAADDTEGWKEYFGVLAERDGV
jgi:hypothetical protein